MTLARPYGITFEQYTRSQRQKFVSNYLADMAAAGIQRARMITGWNQIQHDDNTYHFSDVTNVFTDQLITAAHTAGMDFCLAVWNADAYQQWPSDGGGHGGVKLLGKSPSLANITSFVSTLITYYTSGGGPAGLTEFEYGNENCDTGSNFGNSGAVAAQIGQAVYTTAHAINPAIGIAPPCALRFKTVYFTQWWTDFFTAIAAMSSAPLFKYIAYHHYGTSARVEDGPQLQTLVQSLTTIRNLNLSLLPGTIYPIRVTETGYFTGNCDTQATGVQCVTQPGKPNKYKITYSDIGLWLQQSLDDLRTSGLCDGIDWYTLDYDNTPYSLKSAGVPHLAYTNWQAYSILYPNWQGTTITLSPNHGQVSSTLTVSGANFGAIDLVAITFDSTSVGSATANSSGSFAPVTITVPSGASIGAHTINAVGNSGKHASATFTVVPIGVLTLLPTSGAWGTSITATGSGYGIGELVTISVLQTGDVLATFNASGSGTFSQVMVLPTSEPVGVITVQAVGASSGAVGTASFTVLYPISILFPAADRRVSLFPATDRRAGQFAATSRRVGQFPATQRRTGQFPATARRTGQFPATTRRG